MYAAVLETKYIVLYVILAIVLIFGVAMMVLLRLNFNKTLEHHDDIDRLTGLYTYEGFVSKLNSKNDKMIGMLTLDIYEAHNLENKIGTRKFESILTGIANSILSKLGNCRMAARFNYDVFTIMLPTNETTKAIELSNEIALDITKLSDELFPLIFNWGVAFGYESEETLKNSLLAVKYAKRQNNKILVFNDEIAKTQNIFDKVLADPSIIKDEFCVYYQPKVNATSGEIVGAEALIRWIDNKGNVIMYPNQFIPEFELNGLITKIDLFVLEEACRLLESMHRRNQKPVIISLNFSRINFMNPGIIDVVKDIVSRYVFDVNNLHFEITESAFIDNEDNISTTLLKLKDLGFKIEMDDFGSGYSSISSLLNLKCDIVKMDRFFVENNLKLKAEKVVFESLVKMFRGSDLDVIVEGVETEYVVKQIRGMAPNILIQGYYFFKPMPLAKFERILMDNRFVLDASIQSNAQDEEYVEYIEEQVVEEEVPAPKITKKIVKKVSPSCAKTGKKKRVEIEEVFEDKDDDFDDLDDFIEDEDYEYDEDTLEFDKISKEYKKQYKDRWEAEMQKEYPDLVQKHYEKKFFADKLVLLDDKQKVNYNRVKNTIMSYGLKNRTSKYFDLFTYKNKTVAKIGVVGKSLRLYLAINPEFYPSNQFPHKDVSDVKRHEKTPFLMKVSSNLSVRKGISLIGDLMTTLRLKQDPEYTDIEFIF